MSEVAQKLRQVLKGEHLASPDAFAVAVGTLLQDLGVGVDDPLVSNAILGETEDGSPYPCLQHVVIWETTSCVLSVGQGASLLGELYAQGADPNRVDQQCAAWDVLLRGISEHGSWAGDLAPLGRVLIQAGAHRIEGHTLQEREELLVQEGQDTLAGMIASQEQSTQLFQATPDPSQPARRRGL